MKGETPGKNKTKHLEVPKNCRLYLLALLCALKCESSSATLNANFKQTLGLIFETRASKVNGHNGDCWRPVNVQNGSSAAAAAAPGRQASWPQSSSTVTMTARVFYNSGEQEATPGTRPLTKQDDITASGLT